MKVKLLGAEIDLSDIGDVKLDAKKGPDGHYTYEVLNKKKDSILLLSAENDKDVETIEAVNKIVADLQGIDPIKF